MNIHEKQLYKIAGIVVFSTAVWVLPNVANADNCPDAKEVAEHAIKEGIGSQWQTGEKLKWYLDYFSNNNKPAQTAASKFTFMQALFDNQQLTCYYEWPAEDGKTSNWMTLRLQTEHKVKSNWNGSTCQNFEARNCQFTLLEDGAAMDAMKPASSQPTNNNAPAPASEQKK